MFLKSEKKDPPVMDEDDLEEAMAETENAENPTENTAEQQPAETITRIGRTVRAPVIYPAPEYANAGLSTVNEDDGGLMDAEKHYYQGLMDYGCVMMEISKVEMCMVGAANDDVEYKFLRELKEEGEDGVGVLHVLWIPGESNEADMFTKNVSGPSFNKDASFFVGNDEYM